MSDNYKIAVLLSSYNGKRFISEQIRSIMEQRNADRITLIVRDDGSSDETKDIVKNYMKKYNNIELIEGENIGLVYSFFSLLESAAKREFDYYAFSDQDDFWLPEKLTVAIEKIRESGDGPLLYSSCSRIVDEQMVCHGAETQKKLRNITFFNTAIQNICPGHNQVFNKELAQVVLSRTSNLQNIYSHDLWIANVAVVTGKIIFDNNSHTLYRMHSNNQLGFGEGRYKWIVDHIKRVKKMEGSKISRQLKCFFEYFCDDLEIDQNEEIKSFFSEQNNWSNRLKYIYKTKLYRQKRSETLLFKIIYFIGGYTYEGERL